MPGPAGPDVDGGDQVTQSSGDRTRAEVVGAPTLIAAGAVLLSLVPHLPGFALGPLTLRLAILLPMAGWGLVELVTLAARGDRAARWGTAMVGWGLVASLLSPEPRLATFAHLTADREWLYQASYIGWWAVGRTLPAEARRPVGAALLLGIGANSALALAQSGADGQGILALIDGRAPGFALSSVFLGGLVGSGLVLVCALVARAGARWWGWLAAVALLAAAAEASGTRSALLIGAVISLLALHRAGVARIAAVVVAIAIGVVAAGAIAVDDGVASSVDRLGSSSGGGGVATRTEMWSAGLEAALERPVTGWGDGRFRTATSARTSAAFAADEGPDKLFFDAHNLVVEHLVARGIVGVVLLLGFGWAASRRASGPLAWFASAMAVSWLVAPATVVTAPPMLLCLGLATRTTSDTPQVPTDDRRWARNARHVALAVLVLAGTVQAGRILAASRALEVAETESSVTAIAEARRLFPDDPTLSDTEAQVYADRAFRNGDRVQEGLALAAARRTVRIEPTRHLWWASLAQFEYSYGGGSPEERVERASAAIEQGLERYPWSLSLLRMQYQLAQQAGDDATVDQATEKLCAIGACPPS